jgi:hypothetical protein
MREIAAPAKVAFNAQWIGEFFSAIVHLFVSP